MHETRAGNLVRALEQGNFYMTGTNPSNVILTTYSATERYE